MSGSGRERLPRIRSALRSPRAPLHTGLPRIVPAAPAKELSVSSSYGDDGQTAHYLKAFILARKEPPAAIAIQLWWRDVCERLHRARTRQLRRQQLRHNFWAWRTVLKSKRQANKALMQRVWNAWACSADCTRDVRGIVQRLAHKLVFCKSRASPATWMLSSHVVLGHRCTDTEPDPLLERFRAICPTEQHNNAEPQPSKSMHLGIACRPAILQDFVKRKAAGQWTGTVDELVTSRFASALDMPFQLVRSVETHIKSTAFKTLLQLAKTRQIRFRAAELRLRTCARYFHERIPWSMEVQSVMLILWSRFTKFKKSMQLGLTVHPDEWERNIPQWSQFMATQHFKLAQRQRATKLRRKHLLSWFMKSMKQLWNAQRNQPARISLMIAVCERFALRAAYTKWVEQVERHYDKTCPDVGYPTCIRRYIRLWRRTSAFFRLLAEGRREVKASRRVKSLQQSMQSWSHAFAFESNATTARAMSMQKIVDTHPTFATQLRCFMCRWRASPRDIDLSLKLSAFVRLKIAGSRRKAWRHTMSLYGYTQTKSLLSMCFSTWKKHMMRRSARSRMLPALSTKAIVDSPATSAALWKLQHSVQMSMFVNKIIGIPYLDPRAKKPVASPITEAGVPLQIGARRHTVQMWPLHDAVGEGDLKLVAFLLANELMDPNASDAEGRTALHIACSSYSIETYLPIVVLLLNAGCQVHRRDRSGRSCIDSCSTQVLRCVLQLHVSRMSDRKLTRAEILLAHAFYRRHAMFHGFKVLIPTIAMKVQRQRHASQASGKSAAVLKDEEAKWEADNGDSQAGWEEWLASATYNRSEESVVIEVGRVDVRLPIGRQALPWAERLTGKPPPPAPQSPVCRVRKLLTADKAVSIATFLMKTVGAHLRLGSIGDSPTGMALEVQALQIAIARLQRQREVLELQLNSLRKQGTGTIPTVSTPPAGLPCRIGEIALAIGKAYDTALALRKQNIEVESRLLGRIEQLQAVSKVTKR